MRRFCITLVLVGSLLFAAAPAHAKSSASHRLQAHAGASQGHGTTQRVNRARTVKRVQKYTYGRT